ncbi:type II secretion system protein GspM [Luteibacter aegosomatissinici]|uniref:type II secretion system protein GspM n=1 Tax=Luteibacter aegosomatissinici TaxID=2911539 RepID=UPI001FFC0C88|nr:type II secretion system protein GspM [Luteibacter aegosomatissinici]UPG94932.1 type II secretion system protein GspM [Luteibacter aegosomatissinici]
MITVAKMKPGESRIAAIVLLLIALTAVYFLFIHWWFVAPQLSMADEMDDLRDTQRRYAAAIAERPQLEKRLATLEQGQTRSDAFLAGDDTNAAAAGLMQRVVDVAAAHKEDGACDVVQKMPVPAQDKAGDPYRKVTVNISLRCQMQPMAAVLHDIEEEAPYLFIEDFSIYRNPVAARNGGNAPLEVQFTVSGYIHAARAAKAAS